MAFGIKPTQSMAGPVATGQSYAQQIAGGMPMEQVIAPGVSFSPEMAGGYTQADLDYKTDLEAKAQHLLCQSLPPKELHLHPTRVLCRCQVRLKV